MRFSWALILAVLLSLLQTRLGAQDRQTSTPGSTVIAGTAGLTTGMQGTGPALGGALTHDLNDWLAIEGTTTYYGRGSGADALSANVGLLMNVVESTRRTVPYFAVGGGVYRASFDLGNSRFFGGMGQQFVAGTQMIPLAGMTGFGMMQGSYGGPAVWAGPWSGATFTSAALPAFYANRMGIMTVPANGHWGMRSFTDPALTIGGGVRLTLSPRLTVRPDLRALTVFGGGHMNALAAFSLNVGYRF